MGTITRTAWDPKIENEYEIELPDENKIREALLTFNFPEDGLDKSILADKLAELFLLTDDQRNAVYRNNTRIFNNDVGKVTSKLVKLGKLVRPKTYWVNKPETYSGPDMEIEDNSKTNNIISEESIGDIYQNLQIELAKELLVEIKHNSPEFFERLVIDLLVKMGYGGSREDAGKAVGGSNDGGIDGIINEDRLGLDMVYIQAKQWEGSVSRPEIQKFAGALQGQRARKGIFITTSEFSKGCREYVETIDSKIVLIDGQQLAQYMIEHNVGVSTSKTYEIKRVDSDYFSEDE